MLADQMLFELTDSLRRMRERGVSTPHQRDMERTCLRDIAEVARVMRTVGRSVPKELLIGIETASLDGGVTARTC